MMRLGKVWTIPARNSRKRFPFFRLEKWDENPVIADIIMKKGAFLKLYTDYTKDFNEVPKLLEDAKKKYPKFKELTAEFEQRPECANLRMEHYLLKPVQRLPQYSMLLESYIKKISPSSGDYENATKAYEIVKQAAEHANSMINHGVSWKYDDHVIWTRVNHVEFMEKRFLFRLLSTECSCYKTASKTQGSSSITVFSSKRVRY